MSAFAVTWLPSICSGAMYAAVPMVVAVPVSVAASAIWAMPKSPRRA